MGAEKFSEIYTTLLRKIWAPGPESVGTPGLRGYFWPFRTITHCYPIKPKHKIVVIDKDKPKVIRSQPKSNLFQSDPFVLRRLQLKQNQTFLQHRNSRKKLTDFMISKQVLQASNDMVSTSFSYHVEQIQCWGFPTIEPPVKLVTKQNQPVIFKYLHPHKDRF